jgi:MOB kinase activator 1
MSFFQNFNTHSLRLTRGFKLKQSSPISSPQPVSNSALPQTPQIPQHYQHHDLNPTDTTSGGQPQTIRATKSHSTTALEGAAGDVAGQPVLSHRDIRNYAEQTLGSENALIQAVKLPQDEDLNEWLAVHVVDFYNQINMLYGAITEFCLPTTCPRMIATEEYEYLWQESNSANPINGGTHLPKRPVLLPACEYIENLMNWIQNFFDNDNIFPSKIGAPFPLQFQALVKTIFKRLFRIYAHIYCHHFHEITELGLQSHLNTSLKHYVLFSNEFGLISRKDYGPLEDLVDTMLKR